MTNINPDLLSIDPDDLSPAEIAESGSLEKAVTRRKDRGDASDLVGSAVVRKADGTIVPYVDDQGDEVLGIATGPIPLS